MTNDEAVTVSTDRPLRLTAEGMRSLKKATGMNMSELLKDDDDEANRIQVLAFSELHRRYTRSGHMPDAASLWDEAGTTEVDFTMAEGVDPTDGGS